MIKLLKYLKGYYVHALLTPFFKLVETLCELAVPLVVSSIIDTGIATNDTRFVITRSILIAGLYMFGFISAMVGQRLAAKAALGFGTNIRRALFEHINDLSFAETDKIGSASVVTRLTGDVIMVQNALGMFIRLVMRTPFIVFGALALAMVIDLKLSLIFVIMAVFMVFALVLIMSKTFPKYKIAQAKLDTISALTKETLTGARTVRAFCTQQQENSKFLAAATDAADTNIKIGRISALTPSIAFFIANMSIILILWFGGIQVNIGNLTQGGVIALINYMMQMFLAMNAFANITVIFTRATACSGRINEVFALSPGVICGSADSIDFETDAPLLEFKDVAFAYEGGGEALSDISFALKSGQTLGIIGGTGSGKSTLINLIMRFYDPIKGQIKYYGRDIRDYTFMALRGSIGLVPQKATLMKGSLLENLQMGDSSVTEARALAAMERAQGSEIVKSIGINGHIEQKGSNLSGGQRQRVTIARALVKNPPLLILDDSTSALDFATERRLLKALKQSKAAMIIVSQRINTVKSAQSILVLEEGRISGYGTHETLMASNPQYVEIYNSQTETENNYGGQNN